MVAVETDDEEPHDHQGQADEEAGEEAYHEQLGDGQAAHAGAQNDEVGAGRDDGAENGARRNDGARAAGTIAHLLHHGQEQTAECGGFTHGAAHEAGENDGSHDGGIAETAAHAADKQLSELYDAFRQAAGSHDFTGEHEEGNGHQRIVVGAVEHARRDGHRVPHVGVEHEHHGAEHEHHGDRDAEAQENEERSKKKKKFHTLSSY